MVVNIGDSVLVTLQVSETVLGWIYDYAALLANRLRTAGFEVVALDDSSVRAAIPTPLGVFGSYGQLLVTVRPLASAYGSERDVASVVAGAAEAVGYGRVVSYSGQVVETAAVIDYGNAVNPWTGAPALPGYTQNIRYPVSPTSAPPGSPPPPGSQDNWWEKLGFGLGSGSTLTIAALVFVGALLISRRR